MFQLTFSTGLKICDLIEVVAELGEKYLIVDNWFDQIEKL